MASISKEPGGRKTIQFFSKDGVRKSIRLGKMSQRTAERIRGGVEGLVSASRTGQLDAETAEWLGGVEDWLYEKLVKVELTAAREAVRLGPFVDAYIAGRTDTKPSTITTYRQTEKNVLEHFGADKALRDITPGDADEFRLALLRSGLAENTVRKRCRIAKQFLKAAVRRGLIRRNPFADLPSSIKANRSRDFFITREMAEKVLAECPDAQWKLLFALARYGGLRCPSEVLSLRWDGIDWDKGRMTVWSPKTEHHEGRESRQVPIFPELLPYLLAVFSEPSEGGEIEQYVITRYRLRTQNLRTQLTRIIRRAGLEPWPKLWQNLRATRETELEEDYPGHVVRAWLGHSERVASKHYLQVTDEHFARALQKPVPQVSAVPEAGAAETGARSGKESQVSGYGSAGAAELTEFLGTLRQLAALCGNEWALQDSNTTPPVEPQPLENTSTYANPPQSGEAEALQNPVHSDAKTPIDPTATLSPEDQRALARHVLTLMQMDPAERAARLRQLADATADAQNAPNPAEGVSEPTPDGDRVPETPERGKKAVQQ